MKNQNKVAHWVIFLLSISLLGLVALSHQQKESQQEQIRILEEQKTRDSEQIEKQLEEKTKLEKEQEELKKQLEAKKQEQIRLAQARVQPKATPKASYSGNCEQFRHLIAQYSWNVSTMIAICNSESGGNPNAANWTDNHGVCKGSFGLFQISCHGGQIFDPAANVAAAWGKYVTALNNPKTGYWGYWPWSVCKNGTLSCV